MKKIKIWTLSATILAAVALMAESCKYLDVDPELGITEDEVFSTYSNANYFLSMVYDPNGGKNKTAIQPGFPLVVDFIYDNYFSWAAITDAADCGRLGYAQRNFKQGFLTQEVLRQFTNGTESNQKPIFTAMWGVIRVANMLIEKFPQIKDGSESERNDLLAQAYFIRGFAHFVLCRYFGGMPYIDHVIQADDEWDLPRLSSYETYVRAAADLWTAYEYFEKAGIMRRNTPSNLVPSTYILAKPAGCAALAVRARALLYAASPLNNTVGDEAWKTAAEACGFSLKTAIDNNFDLLTKDHYQDNYTGSVTTNEVLWGYTLKAASNTQNFAGMLSYCQTRLGGNRGSSGTHPTQNFVDRFETADGYLLRTELERAVATAAGSYDEQRPYRNRDPRLDMVIIHDGSPQFGKAVITSEGNCFNIYYDPATGSWPTTNLNSVEMTYGADWGSRDNATTGESNTGYYYRRYWDGAYSGSHQNLDPMFRVGEMYLEYAEAVNEAYGPAGRAGGMTVTALEAVNIVRERVGMPNVRAEYSADKEVFRDYVRNERCVEVAYESNHYWFDIRRWKTAPELMGKTLYGMYVEKCPVSAEYPEGRKYTRRAIPTNRQCIWKDYMYVLPIPDDLANTMKNFVNNQQWQ